MRPLPFALGSALVTGLLAAGCTPFGEDLATADASTDGGSPTPADGAAPPDSGGSDAEGGASTCPNGALRFAGGGFVEVPHAASMDAPGALTVEAWIKPDTAIGGGEAHIVSHHDYEVSDGWVLMLFGGLAFRVYSGTGTGQGDEIKASSPQIELGKWHHVAGVFEPSSTSGRMRLYTDGVLVKQQSANRTKADAYAGPLRIGLAAYSEGFGFEGVIDEVRVSSVARYTGAYTPQHPLPDDEPGTIGTWHFSEGSGDAAKESRARLPDGARGKIGSGSATVPAWATPECPLPAK